MASVSAVAGPPGCDPIADSMAGDAVFVACVCSAGLRWRWWTHCAAPRSGTHVVLGTDCNGSRGRRRPARPWHSIMIRLTRMILPIKTSGGSNASQAHRFDPTCGCWPCWSRLRHRYADVGPLSRDLHAWKLTKSLQLPDSHQALEAGIERSPFAFASTHQLSLPVFVVVQLGRISITVVTDTSLVSKLGL